MRGTNMEGQRYTGFVGQKFNEDGSVRRFPGNTVISKITPDMPIYSGLVEKQQQLKNVPCAGKYAFLPPSSLHMTVIEGVCDQVRRKENWPKNLPLDMPMEQVNRFFVECYGRLSPPESFNMRLARTRFSNLLFMVLEPADKNTSKSLKTFRDSFAKETGIRFPNHDTYTFHISMAYNLIPLTDEDRVILKAAEEEVFHKFSIEHPTFRLKAPTLTSFDTMFRFDDLC